MANPITDILINITDVNGLPMLQTDHEGALGTQWDDNAQRLRFTRDPVYADMDMLLLFRFGLAIEWYEEDVSTSDEFLLSNTYTQYPQLSLQVAFRDGEDYRLGANSLDFRFRSAPRNGGMPEPPPSSFDDLVKGAFVDSDYEDSMLSFKNLAGTVVSEVEIIGGGGGGAGRNGWTPVLSIVSDGERRVLCVIDYTGGTGIKPQTGLYVGASGLAPDIASAIDIRGSIGPQGIPGAPGQDGATGGTGSPGTAATVTVGATTTGSPGTQATVTNVGTANAAILNFTIPRGADGSGGGGTGSDGDDGWTPVLAVVSDGERRVFQVVNYIDGSGTKPTVGLYVGTSGLVPNVAAAMDVRGSIGQQGIQGIQGDTGPAGYTPVRGTDYWTSADIAYIQSYIDDQLGVITNGSY